MWYRAIVLVSAAFVAFTPEMAPDVLGGHLPAQEDNQPAKFQGNDNCYRCHFNASPRDFQDFVTLYEAQTFYPDDEKADKRLFPGADKHAEAFKLLMTPLGARMTDALKLTDTSKYALASSEHALALRGSAEIRRQCLTCHSDWRIDKPEAELPPISFAEEGVSCEACHGPSSKWETEHAKIEWRARAVNNRILAGLPARFQQDADGMALPSKESLGMVDVRNPIARARQCFSCHIGNATQGKIVTHEVYAAGHPPLPGIEIETFATVMPPHWRYLNEKGEFEFKDDYLLANGLDAGHAKVDFPRTKAVLVGALMTLRESMNLLHTQAAGTGVWPELGVFDCQSCHHDLRSPSWRQTRGYANSPPGRIYPPAWPQALVKLGLFVLSADGPQYQQRLQDFQKQLDAVRRDLDAQPFGERGAVQASTKTLMEHLDGLAQEVVDKAVDRTVAERAVRFLCQLDPKDYPDYHAARQIAWAISAIETELRTLRSDFPPPKYAPVGVQRMKLTDVERESRDARIERGKADLAVFEGYKGRRAAQEDLVLLGLDKLFPALRLNLPAGQGEENSIAVEFPEVLKSMADYNPDTFREQLKLFSARRFP